MGTEEICQLYQRDLQRLETEIGLYTGVEKLWVIVPGTTNPGGNLCLHLAGNLQHYIGNVLGHSGYIRNRPAEFSSTGIHQSELLGILKETATIVVKTLVSLSEEQLFETYPEKVFDYEMTTGYFLLHLLAHLNYHLGQVNYHRRFAEG